MNHRIPNKRILHRHGVEESLGLLKITRLGKRRNNEVPGVMGFVGHGMEQFQ